MHDSRLYSDVFKGTLALSIQYNENQSALECHINTVLPKHTINAKISFQILGSKMIDILTQSHY